MDQVSHRSGISFVKQVFFTFLYVQVLANWFCTQLYDTSHRRTWDKVDVRMDKSCQDWNSADSRPARSGWVRRSRIFFHYGDRKRFQRFLQNCVCVWGVISSGATSWLAGTTVIGHPYFSSRVNSARPRDLSEAANEKLRREIDVLSWRFCDICSNTKPPRYLWASGRQCPKIGN